MGSFSIWHWLIVGVIALLLFGGGGKIPKLMRDLGQGVNAFKKGLKETKEPSEKETAQKLEAADDTKMDESTSSSSKSSS